MRQTSHCAQDHLLPTAQSRSRQAENRADYSADGLWTDLYRSAVAWNGVVSFRRSLIDVEEKQLTDGFRLAGKRPQETPGFVRVTATISLAKPRVISQMGSRLVQPDGACTGRTNSNRAERDTTIGFPGAFVEKHHQLRRIARTFHNRNRRVDCGN
jgi:hypothetical protein